MRKAVVSSSNFPFGHRERLRERFRRGGEVAFSDEELLELLLTFAIPRRDVRPAARELLRRFGGLAPALAQPMEKLAATPDLGGLSALLLHLVRTILVRSLEGELREGKKISSPDDVADYLRVLLGHQPRECVLLLCLNSSNRLVHHGLLAEGTINQAPVYPREIARLALEHGASGVVLVHNHPGGACRPSNEDLELTRLLSDALGRLDIHLHDHLIVTNDQVYSITAGRTI